MTQIIFIHPDGRGESLDVPNGTSLMHAATSAGVDGIIGECGGAAMCATCHVYIDASQAGLLSPADEVEAEMLESTAAERRPTSRLSCQIKVTDALEGLTIYLPETQV